jgi:hypothetical protein
MLVRNIHTKFGVNAGKIWQHLEEKGVYDEKSLMKTTHMTNNDFFAGVGWLVREGKIRKEDSHYSLGDTNLADQVGSIAGRVWKILEIWEEADIITLKKLTDVNEEDIYSALGWLAREDKIYFDEDQGYRLK